MATNESSILKKSQLRRAEALRISRSVLGSGAAVFSGGSLPAERTATDLVSLSEYIISGIQEGEVTEMSPADMLGSLFGPIVFETDVTLPGAPQPEEPTLFEAEGDEKDDPEA